MTLPPNTYGVRCEFHPGSTQYTYLVDQPHHGLIKHGDYVVVASPKGGYKVILVVGIADDLAPVDLQYMKYIVHKVNTETYDILMHNLTAGDEVASNTEGNMLSPAPPTSPLIDEGDTSNVDEPGAPQGQNIQGLSPNPRHGSDPGASG